MAFKHPHRYGILAMVRKKDYKHFSKYQKLLKNHVQFFMKKEFFNDIAPQHLSICYFSYPENYPKEYIEKLVPKIRSVIRNNLPLQVKVKGLIGWWELSIGVPALLWNITDLGNFPKLHKEVVKTLAPYIEHFNDPEMDFTPHIGVALCKKEKFKEIKKIVDHSKEDKEQVLIIDRFYIFYPNEPKEVFSHN